jgi:hypothetical protein
MTDNDAAGPSPRIPVPPYNYANPGLWFNLARKTIEQCGYTNKKTIFFMLYGQLPADKQADGEALINDDSEEILVKLEKIVLKGTNLPDTSRITTLLTQCQRGTMKPTEYVSRMRQVLGPSLAEKNEALLRAQLINSLPSIVKIALATQINTLDVDALAELADDAMLYSEPQHANAISHTASTTNDRTQLLQKQIQNMESEQKDTRSALNSVVTSLTSITQQLASMQVQNNAGHATEQALPASNYEDGNTNFQRGQRFGSFNRNSPRSSFNRNSPRVSFRRNQEYRNNAPATPSKDYNEEICFKHRRYGDQAWGCVPPCSYRQGNANGMA